jgi:DNA-binding transcriptional ArsR family regulator
MERAIFDIDTGEYIDTLHTGDRIVRKSVIDRLHDLPVDESKMCFQNGDWGKAYDEALSKLAKLNLIAIEYKMILLFIPLIKINSGLLAYGNYKPVNMKWIETELNITRNTVSKTIKRLLDLRIISENYSGKEKIYFFNPYIYQKGRYINKTLFEMFKKSDWVKM